MRNKHASGCVPPCYDRLCQCQMCHALPAYEPVKDSKRDRALLRMYRDRARRVVGWLQWPHSEDEIAGIRLFLETGDDSRLPLAADGRELYPKKGGSDGSQGSEAADRGATR